MKILIDFDDTLFNTRRFRQEYKKIFATHGVNSTLFEKHYSSSVKKVGSIVLYDPEKHLRTLEKARIVKASRLKKAVYALASKSEKYLFSDACSFLSAFEKRNIFIITHSQSRFQRTKLRHSGLCKYVNRIIFTGKLKSCAVKILRRKNLLKKAEKVYFIDDRVEQINDVKKRYSKSITILMRRTEGRYRDQVSRYCDYVVKNLKEAKKILLYF